MVFRVTKQRTLSRIGCLAAFSASVSVISGRTQLYIEETCAKDAIMSSKAIDSEIRYSGAI